MALGSVRSIGILIVGAVSSHNHCKVLADDDAKKGERERPYKQSLMTFHDFRSLH